MPLLHPPHFDPESAHFEDRHCCSSQRELVTGQCVPKNVNVTVKFDLVGTYSDLLKKFDSMSDKDMQRVVDILEKKSDIIQKIIVNKLDK